jgi:hypothetical protein
MCWVFGAGLFDLVVEAELTHASGVAAVAEAVALGGP